MDQRKIEIQKRKKRRGNIIVLLILAVLLAAFFIISMNTGYTRLSPADTIRTLFGGGTHNENLILFRFRLPRIIVSILVGAGLALSGCIIQGISQNALADPGLLGINAGAGLTVIIYVLFFGASTMISVFTLPFLALAGAGGAAVLIYCLSYKNGEGIAPMRLILTGIAVQAGISALTTVLVIRLDETQFNFVATWQAGGIWGSSWRFVLSLLPWLLLLLPYILYKARTLDVLNMGNEVAQSLGVPVETERRRLLTVSVALAAACVSVSGGIGFVGLIAPHLARRLVGPRHAILLPVCALTGMVLLSAADMLARIILQPAELPTGILVAVIGAPYFLYLLTKSRQ